MYSQRVFERIPAVLLIVALTACSTASFHDRPECSDELMADWHIPAAWYLRALTPEKAHEQVLAGNLGVDAIRDRWEQLHDRWRDGDQYWLYRRPEERWLSPLGWQEGIALNRGCRQLGFVTTSVQVDEETTAARR
jgi:hypothetical protein